MAIPVGSKVDPALDAVDKDFQPANARDAEIQATCEAQTKSQDVCDG